MRVFLASAVIFWSPALVAEPATVEAELRELAIPFEPTDRGFHAHAFAQLVGAMTDKVAESSISAGGELRYAGARCDYVRAGGQARLAWRDGALPSAEQWASVCIPIQVMELEHHLEWDVRPALLAPLLLRAGTNRRETVAFHWQPLRAPLPAVVGSMERAEAQRQGQPAPVPSQETDAALPPGDVIIFDVHVESTFLWSSSRALVHRETPEATPFRYERRQRARWGEARDFSVDIGAGGGDFVENGAAVHAWFVKLDNLAVGPVYTTGGIGIASAGAGPFVDDVQRQVEVTSPRAVLALETGGEHLHGELRAAHDVAVVPDGYVTVDSRLASTLGLTFDATRVDVVGALATTDIHVPGAMPLTRWTGGGSLTAVRRLSSHLEASVQLEVARSFYAAGISELDFTPRWGVNGFAALRAVAGR